MSRSLPVKRSGWEISFLGERALTLSPELKGDCLADIHRIFRCLEKKEIPGVIDIVPAYEQIAVIYRDPIPDIQLPAKAIFEAIEEAADQDFESRLFEVPVCYELGLDWDEVQDQTSLSKQEIVRRHSSKIYTVAMMGFLPGFIYLSGLDRELKCNRKEHPRTKIPCGAVGIGGMQTGIYALESPGGWQIIGRTPKLFFDVHQNPPIEIQPGDKIRFTPISKQEFKEIES